METHQKELTYSGSRFELRPYIVSDPAKPPAGSAGLAWLPASGNAFTERLPNGPRFQRRSLAARHEIKNPKSLSSNYL